MRREMFAPKNRTKLSFVLRLVLAAFFAIAFVQPMFAQRGSFAESIAAGVITAPASTTVGKFMRKAISVTIQGVGGSVTVTSSDASKVTVASTPTGVGGSSASFLESGTFAVYVDGLDSTGSATLTVSASGFSNATTTVNLGLSGFTGNIAPNLILGTSDAPVVICPSLLTNVGAFIEDETLSPGVSTASVIVTSSDTSKGTITTSPVVFNAGDTCKSPATALHAVAAGTATVTLGTPVGYSTPNP